MEKRNIEVRQEVVDYIQRLHFELEARKDVIATIIENHKADDTVELFESIVFTTYSKQLSEIKAEYEIAKGLLDEFIPTDILDNKKFDWNLNFATSMLELSIY